MRFNLRLAASILLLLTVLSALGLYAADKKKKNKTNAAAMQMDE
jgi:hypothetical protein